MLLYGLTLSKMHREIMEEHIRRGKPPPDVIQGAPELHQGLQLYYIAFLDLTSCRQLSEVIGPIDWITIDRYCERHNITGEQYEDMHYYLGRMDLAYLEHVRKQKGDTLKRTANRTKAPTPPPRARHRRK